MNRSDIVFLPDMSIFSYALKPDFAFQNNKDKDLRIYSIRFLNYLAEQRGMGKNIAYIPQELYDKMQQNWFKDGYGAVLALESIVNIDNTSKNARLNIIVCNHPQRIPSEDYPIFNAKQVWNYVPTSV